MGPFFSINLIVLLFLQFKLKQCHSTDTVQLRAVMYAQLPFHSSLPGATSLLL